MPLLRGLLILLSLALVALIVWAFGAANFWASFSLITADAWGKVTLGDLYLGFLATGIIIAIIERHIARTAALLVALFFLGNVVTGLWLAWRLPKLIAFARNKNSVTH